MGTKLRVTNNDTGESVVVKVNDRGSFHGNRVIDLSHAAAQTLGMLQSGVCSVKISYLVKWISTLRFLLTLVFGSLMKELSCKAMRVACKRFLTIFYQNSLKMKLH